MATCMAMLALLSIDECEAPALGFRDWCGTAWTWVAHGPNTRYWRFHGGTFLGTTGRPDVRTWENRTNTILTSAARVWPSCNPHRRFARRDMGDSFAEPS